MAVQSADAEAGKDIGMHDVSLQRFSKVSWTEEEPTRPLRSIVERTNSRKYDIATLMLIRATMNPGSVQLRINPGALTEVFRSSNQQAFFGRGRFRSRTNTFSGTFGSIVADEDTPYHSAGISRWQGHLHQPRAPLDTFQERPNDGFRRIPTHVPVRQPYAPPKTPLLQKDRGFANFIKQHASPTHVRVTAGGRIVPTGRPPTMSDLSAIRRQGPQLDSLGNSMGGTTATTSFSRFGPEVQAQAGSNEGIGSIMHKEAQAGGSTPILTNQWGGPALPTLQPTLLAGNSGFPPALYPFNQAQFGLLPPMTLGDRSIIHMQNGITYRSYFNGFNVVNEVLNPTQQLGLATGPVMGGYPDQTTRSAFPNQGAYSQLNDPAASSTRIKESTGVSSELGVDNITKKALQIELEDQKSRLTALDKHIALHRHRLSPLDYSTCVTQRKQFVGMIDSIRMKLDSSDLVNVQGSSETSGSNAPRTHTIKTKTGTYIATNHGTYETYNYLPLPSVGQASGASSRKQHGFRQPGAQPASAHLGEKARSHVTFRSGGLSPVAPSFVPSGANPSALQKASISDEKSPTVAFYTNTRPSHVPLLTQDEQSQEGENTSGAVKGSPKFLDFCKRRQFSSADRRKLFCSTEDEFAAVIHRVREQAEMLGCKGGQSKDPAYDAEQDIRWAMADGDPIPLAEGLPEYFFNPRPWNWEDSEFNYRVPMKKIPDSNHRLGGHHRVCLLTDEPGADAIKITSNPEIPGLISVLGEQSSVDLGTDSSRAKTPVRLKGRQWTTDDSDLREGVHPIIEAEVSWPKPFPARIDTTSSHETPVKASTDHTPLKDVSNVNVKLDAVKPTVTTHAAVDPENKEQIDPKGLVVQSRDEFQLTTPTRRPGRAARCNISNRSSNGTSVSENEGQDTAKDITSLSPTKVGVPRFLQKLLRSPRQRASSCVQTNLATVTNIPPPKSATYGKDASKRLAAVDNGIDKPSAIPSSRRLSQAHDRHRAPNKMHGNQTARSQKAQSSIAPTELHVQGYVPQVQRANFSAPHHLQPKESYPKDLGVPQYDGADDKAPSINNPQSSESFAAIDGPRVSGKNQSQSDTTEGAKNPVTTFQTYQQDLPRDHGPRVEHFFKKLVEEERKEMAAVAAKDGKP